MDIAITDANGVLTVEGADLLPSARMGEKRRVSIYPDIGYDWKLIADAIRQQQAELAALKAENERLIGVVDSQRLTHEQDHGENLDWAALNTELHNHVRDLEQQLAATSAELAAARVDAGRLDWLQSNRIVIAGDDLRAAIDAAMKGEGL